MIAHVGIIKDIRMKFKYLVRKTRLMFKIHDWLFGKDYYYCEPCCGTLEDHYENETFWEEVDNG